MSPGWTLAAVAAAMAVLLIVPARPALTSRLERRPGADRPARLPMIMVIGGILAALVAGLPALQLAVLGVALGAVVVVRGQVRRGREAAAASRTRAAVVEACEAILGELRAGQPPARALEAAAEAWPDLTPVVRSARLGGDVPEALRAAAARPGAGELRRVAAVWRLSAETGAGLTYAVGRVLETVRSRQAADRLVQSELSAARATARLVMALPVVVLVASDGLGVDPWGFLLGTWPGVVCLAAGVTLCAAGLEWIERIAVRAVGGED